MNELIWASGWVAACAICSSFCLPRFILCIWATNGAIILDVIVAAGHRVSSVFFVLFVVGAVHELNPVLGFFFCLVFFWLLGGSIVFLLYFFLTCATMVFRCGYYNLFLDLLATSTRHNDEMARLNSSLVPVPISHRAKLVVWGVV